MQINVSVSLFLMYRESFSGPGYSGLVAFIYTLDSQNSFWFDVRRVVPGEGPLNGCVCVYVQLLLINNC